MIAVPTRELSGHAVALAWSRGQARVSDAAIGATEVGSVTSARLRAACSGSNRSVVLSGAWSPFRSASGEPSEPSAVGANSSASQSVGVSANVLSDDLAGFSYELTRASETPVAQEVGIRMKLPLLARASKVSSTRSIWTASGKSPRRPHATDWRAQSRYR